MDFFTELKRRNVIRVGLAYVLMGWVLLQGADFIFDLIDTPNWVIQALTAVVGLGLPVALFIAWAFELTPEGIKREEDVDRSQSISPHTGRKLDRAIIAFLALVIVMMGAERLYQGDGDKAPASDQTVEAQAGTDPTIAVLPFVNMSSDAEQEYFSDGITEEILNRLAKVEGLQVSARTSAFSYKGQNLDVREIAETLGVENILEGSVRRDGDQVRITAQLVRAEDGFHLWSESYDRKLESIFAVQDEISSEIAQALQVSLGIAAAPSARQVNPEAYDLYLQARSLHHRRGTGVMDAIRLFEESLAIDPDFAPAWAGLAHSLHVIKAYVSVAEWSILGNVEERGDEAANRALTLDPGSATALHAKANALLTQYEWAKAEEYFEQAVAADPDSTTIMEDYASTLRYLLRSEKAKAVTDRMIELDPVVAIYRWQGVNTYAALGDQEKFEEHLEAGLDITHGFRILNNIKLGQLLKNGKYAEAHEWIDEVPPVLDWASARSMHRMIDWVQDPSQPLDEEMRAALDYYPLFALWAGRDDIWAEVVWNTPWSSYWENAPSVVAALQAPILVGDQTHLFGHPSTIETIRQIKLDEYWRNHGWPARCQPVGDTDFTCQ